MKLSQKIVAALTLILLLALVFYPMYCVFLAGLCPLLIGGLVSALIVAMAGSNFSIEPDRRLGFRCRWVKKIFSHGKEEVQNTPVDDANSAELGIYSPPTDNATPTAVAINQELNKVQAGVMRENNHVEIVYMSDSLIELLKKLQINRDGQPRSNLEIDPLCASAAQPPANSRRRHNTELHVAGQVIRLPTD
ncbi:MAG: hypothetical protein ACXWF8_18505 [Methylobacter sp.]